MNTLRGWLGNVAVWSILGCSAGWGLFWALLSIVAWTTWWSGPYSSVAERFAYAVLLWPLFAASLAWRVWHVDILLLTLAIGIATGLLVGGCLVISLHAELV